MEGLVSRAFLKSRGSRRIALMAAAAGVILWLSLHFGIGEFLTFENFQKNRDRIQQLVEEHYAVSVITFIAAYVSTAFFVPGALVLTIAAGFLFGVVRGSFYTLIGALTGALLAFLLSRFVIGGWIQQHYRGELQKFNKELERHGVNYLIILRLVPLFPFFLINYFAGMTRISPRTYLIATFVGMLPGIVIYAYAGQNLRHLQTVEDAVSPRIMLILALLAFFAILPVVVRHVKERK